MRFGVMAAVAACTMAVPADAVTSINIGNATTVTYQFTFAEPVTAGINVMLTGPRVHEDADGSSFSVIVDEYDYLTLSAQRIATGAISSRVRVSPNGDRSYTIFNYLTFWVDGSDAVPTVSIRAAFGVPEPATWALMIAGFGAVGGAMRRRRLAVAC